MIRRRAVLYIGAWALTLACRPKLAPLVPADVRAVSLDSAAVWVGRTVPGRALVVRFTWRYRDERASFAGRGSARIAPPDSLRFDYAGPLGLGVGAAVVIGDSVAWAEPPEQFRMLVPAVRLLWTAFGAIRSPPGQAIFAGVVPGNGAGQRVLRFLDGVDTLEYVLAQGSVPVSLGAEWRRGGTIIARSRTEFGGGGAPRAARIDFPDAPARFELTVVGVDTVEAIPPSLWRAGR